MAASKLASVFSGYAAEACNRRVDWTSATRRPHYVHRDDPNILECGLGEEQWLNTAKHAPGKIESIIGHVQTANRRGR